MTLTLEISPSAEAHLRLLAAQQDEEESSLAARLLTQILTEDEADFAESVAVVRRGLGDLDAGDRGVLLEDYRATGSATRQTPSSEAAT